MPELPEVETRLIYFKERALRQRIERVRVTATNMIKSPAARSFARSLRGRRFDDAFRRGKYLIIALDDRRFLALHFGMGGDLVLHLSDRDLPDFTRIDFHLSGGKRLAFTCPRKICRVFLVGDLSDIPALRRMGPEPLGPQFTLSYLEEVISESPRRQIKPLLLDQNRVAGVGNIYADEILFGARIRPDRRASSLTIDEIKLLRRETRRVLRQAIKAGGDENFPSEFLVSRSASEKGCLRCSSSIRRRRIGGRTAYFCEHCQK
jgi:formamidopyrimidine-DNA glycosylase